MKVQECVVSDEFVRGTQDELALREAIVMPPGVKEQILNHSLLSMSVCAKVPFASTGLHGMYILYGPPRAG